MLRYYVEPFERTLKLVDATGCTITEREVNNRKEAKAEAAYLLSDKYAHDCETDSLNADHAELWVKGEHIQDYYK